MTQRRAGEMLRRRYIQKEKAAGEAERRQEADAAGGKCRNPAKSIYERVKIG